MSGAADIREWTRDVRRFADTWPGDGIKVVDRAIVDRLRADTGDGGLSHGRNMGRATTRITSSGDSAEVVADGSRRVWGILEGGTSAHTVDAGPGRTLRTPFGPRRRVVVRGVPARNTFSRGAERGLADAARDAEAAFARIVG